MKKRRRDVEEGGGSNDSGKSVGDDDARERLVGLVFSCLVGREERGRGARSRGEGT